MCTAILFLLMAFLLILNGVRRQEEALVSRIAPQILRFHVLANSDSAEDQALKLMVKDYLLEEIRSRAEVSQHNSKHMMEKYILDNKTVLEQRSEEFIRSYGFDYSTEICLETCMFPEKTYGDLTFPAGMYDAVRVIIGDGAGQNFWCILYPSLCYLDSTYTVVPDSSKKYLQNVLPEDDFAALMKTKTEQDLLLPRVTVRFKLLEWLTER